MAIEEQIKELAYIIWEQEGRPEGKNVEHYFRAKQIIEEREAVQAGVTNLTLTTPPSPQTGVFRVKKRKR